MDRMGVMSSLHCAPDNAWTMSGPLSAAFTGFQFGRGSVVSLLRICGNSVCWWKVSSVVAGYDLHLLVLDVYVQLSVGQQRFTFYGPIV